MTYNQMISFLQVFKKARKRLYHLKVLAQIQTNQTVVTLIIAMKKKIKRINKRNTMMISKDRTFMMMVVSISI